MKFLLVLSIFAASSAFASQVICYESASHGAEVSYIIDSTAGVNTVVYPELHLGTLALNSETDCLDLDPTGTGNPPEADLFLCLSTGQRINRRVPVFATDGNGLEVTVYCQNSIEALFVVKK